MLRTRMDDRAERLARQALPVLVAGLAVLATGAALGSRPVALAGLAGYAAGLAWWGRALVAPARTAPPKAFATWSVTAALGWWVVAIALVGWRLATSPSWATLADGYGIGGRGRGRRLRRPAPLRGAVPPHPDGARRRPLRGAGGPGVARPRGALAGHRGQPRPARLPAARRRAPCAWRCPCSCSAPSSRSCRCCCARSGRPWPRAGRCWPRSPRPTRPACGPRPHRCRPRAPRSGRPAAHRRRERRPRRHPRRGRRPRRGGTGRCRARAARRHRRRRGPSWHPTGHTTRVRVEAHDMSYSPSSLTVPYGDRLVIDLVNLDDGSPHDLTFGGGIQTGRLMPGRSATLDVGVLGASTQGWCRIIGHRQMGMVLDVVVAGAPATTAGATRRHPPRPRHPAARPRSTCPAPRMPGSRRCPRRSPRSTPRAPTRSR